MNANHFVFILQIFLVVHTSCYSQCTIEGELYDQKNNQPISGVYILVNDAEIVAYTDEQGFFSFPRGCEWGDSLVLFTSHVSTGLQKHILPLNKELKTQHIHLYLNVVECEQCKLTDLVLVEENQGLGQEIGIRYVVDFSKRIDLAGKSASQLFSELQGVQMLNTGVGVSKPIIRGFWGNRVSILHEGVLLNGQQWGTDHGLELDGNSISRVQLWRGPQVLLHSFDALTGLIEILPEKVPAHQKHELSIGSWFHSNNLQTGFNLQGRGNWHQWIYQIKMSLQKSADFKIPANRFIYNGYELPIYNQNLKNTAFYDYNFDFSLGRLFSWGIIKGSYKRYRSKSGIFSGAIGIPRFYALSEDGDNWDFDEPSQDLTHQTVYLQCKKFRKNKFDISSEFSYQNNQRNEYSFPDAHIRGQILDGNDRTALSLNLQTFQLKNSLGYLIRDGLEIKAVLEQHYQVNKKSGFDHLLPDFNIFRNSFASFVQYKATKHWNLEASFRFDFSHVTGSYFKLPVIIQGIDTLVSLSSPSYDKKFAVFGFALGCSFQPEKGNMLQQIIVAKSSRIPYANELLMDGIHHGTFRHERGNSSLQVEEMWQLEYAQNYRWNQVNFNLSLFSHYFTNYIYLSPSGRFSALPEAGQLYLYKQNQAIFLGVEGEMIWKILPFLSWEEQFEYVWNQNLDQGTGLPFSPPAHLKTSLRAEQKKDFKIFSQSFFALTHSYYFEQNLTDTNEKPSPGFMLLHISAGTTILSSYFPVQISFSVQNILDQGYLLHTSRYRSLELFEQGRNFILSLKCPIQFTGKEKRE